MSTTRPWSTPAEFLADERSSFAPFEAILSLELDQLDRGPKAHGWSARDVLSHLVGWHEVATDVARELRDGRTSPRKAAADAEWERRGDALNEEIRAEWEALDVEAFRARARVATASLRGALAEVPVERWWDHEEYFEYFLSEMQAHYDDHRAALAIVLGGGV
jgi:hypothetical protein